MIPATMLDDDPTQPAEHATQADECRLMAALSIIRAGRGYFYDGYQYDRFADAVAYARLVRGQRRQPGPSSPTQLESLESPTASDRQLTSALSISVENGRFVFEGFRYDRLVDAANYARRRGARAATRQE